jgi:hypothetical protein
MPIPGPGSYAKFLKKSINLEKVRADKRGEAGKNYRSSAVRKGPDYVPYILPFSLVLNVIR